MQIPKVKLDDFKAFVMSKEIVAIGSAILVTPMLLTGIESVIARFPVFKDHITLALTIAAFVIFIFATKVKGIFGAVLVGIAGGVLITGLTPYFETTLGKLRIGGS